MAADFQNVYRYNVCLCSSVVFADVLQHNCNPVVVFFFYLHVGIPARFLLSYIVGKNVDADCWFPGQNADAAAAKRRNCRLLLLKQQFSKSSVKTSSTTESSAAMFLVDLIMYPDPDPLACETSDQMIRFNLLHFLSEEKVQVHLYRKNYRKFHSWQALQA